MNKIILVDKLKANIQNMISDDLTKAAIFQYESNVVPNVGDVVQVWKEKSLVVEQRLFSALQPEHVILFGPVSQ